MIGSRFLIRSTAAVVVAVAAGACGGGGDGNDGGATAGNGGSDTVRIVNFRFTPPEVTVRAGTTVTWTNGDSAVHSIKDTSPLATPVSPDLGQDGTFSITYGQPGSYSYICGVHQYMTGTVAVAA